MYQKTHSSGRIYPMPMALSVSTASALLTGRAVKTASLGLSFLLPLVLQGTALAEGRLPSQRGAFYDISEAEVAIARDPRQETLQNIRYESYQSHYDINPDYTYQRSFSSQVRLLTPSSLKSWQRASQSFYPNSQSVELIEAYVIQPDGRRVEVTEENIFTRPSRESQSAPGFSSSMTTTVVFPQLEVGSQIYSAWRFKQETPSVIGLHEIDRPSFSYNSREETVSVNLPKDLPLRWAKRGDYQVSDAVEGDRRLITATLKDHRGQAGENGMTSTWDVTPLFMFSNLDRWEELGATYWRQSQEKLIITPEIETLAADIVGDQTGEAAARAIYNWVAQNLEYVAVYLDESAGWVPHSVPEILKNGYGDCKDHVALMQALLQARGIEALPTLVNTGNWYEPLPLPASQFNHAIIYLPEYDIFADPTNPYASFGQPIRYLGNKHVILATETGTRVQVPPASAQDNRYEFSGVINIDEQGTITGNSRLQLQGHLSNSARSYFASDTPEQLADNILASTPEGGYGALQTSDLTRLDEPVVVEGSWTSPQAIALGKQSFFTVPFGLNYRDADFLRSYLTYSDRRYPLRVKAETLQWNYRIALPEGHRVSRLPEPIRFSNSAGAYTSEYQRDGNSVQVTRKLILAKDVYQPQEYADLEQLIYKPLQDFRDVVVLEQQNLAAAQREEG